MRRYLPSPVSKTSKKHSPTASPTREVSAPLLGLQAAIGNQVLNWAIADRQSGILGSSNHTLNRSPIQAKALFRGLSHELGDDVSGLRKQLLKPKDAGTKMPSEVQRKMEAAFNTDFSDVRIHEGPEAEAIGAIAYTQGSHIHTPPGKLNLKTQAGQQLLGHELAHVLQQRAGQVSIPKPAGIPLNTDSHLEAEADRLGAKAARGEQANMAGTQPVHSSSPVSNSKPIQRVKLKTVKKALKKGLNALRLRPSTPSKQPELEEEPTKVEDAETPKSTAATVSPAGYRFRAKNDPLRVRKDPLLLRGVDKSRAIAAPALPAKKLEKLLREGISKQPSYKNEATVKGNGDPLTKYFKTDSERRPHAVQVSHQGTLINKAGALNTQPASRRNFWVGSPQTGRHIFVQDVAGNLYTADEAATMSALQGPDKGKKVHHTTLVAGENVRAAGEIETSISGWIKAISDRSGHYKPRAELTYQFVKQLFSPRKDGGKGANPIDTRNATPEDLAGKGFTQEEINFFVGEPLNKETQIELGGAGKEFPEGLGLSQPKESIKLTYRQFLQTGGNEAQIRLKHKLNNELAGLVKLAPGFDEVDGDQRGQLPSDLIKALKAANNASQPQPGNVGLGKPSYGDSVDSNEQHAYNDTFTAVEELKANSFEAENNYNTSSPDDKKNDEADSSGVDSLPRSSEETAASDHSQLGLQSSAPPEVASTENIPQGAVMDSQPVFSQDLINAVRQDIQATGWNSKWADHHEINTLANLLSITIVIHPSLQTIGSTGQTYHLLHNGNHYDIYIPNSQVTGGLEFRKIPGDGDCFYEAIAALQQHYQAPNQKSGRTLRSLVEKALPDSTIKDMAKILVEDFRAAVDNGKPIPLGLGATFTQAMQSLDQEVALAHSVSPTASNSAISHHKQGAADEVANADPISVGTSPLIAAGDSQAKQIAPRSILDPPKDTRTGTERKLERDKKLQREQERKQNRAAWNNSLQLEIARKQVEKLKAKKRL